MLGIQSFRYLKIDVKVIQFSIDELMIIDNDEVFNGECLIDSIHLVMNKVLKGYIEGQNKHSWIIVPL